MKWTLALIVVLVVLNFNTIFSKVEQRNYLNMAYEYVNTSYDVSEDFDEKRQYVTSSDFQIKPTDALSPKELSVNEDFFAILDGQPENTEFVEDGSHLLAKKSIVASGDGEFLNTSNRKNTIQIKTNVGLNYYVFTYSGVVWYSNQSVKETKSSTVDLVGANTIYNKVKKGQVIGYTTDASTLIIQKNGAELAIISLSQYYEEVNAVFNVPSSS